MLVEFGSFVLSDEQKRELAALSPEMRAAFIDYDEGFLRDVAPLGVHSAEYVAGIRAEMEFLLSLEVAAEEDDT